MKKKTKMFVDYIAESMREFNITLDKKTTSNLLLKGIIPEDIQELILSTLEGYFYGISDDILTDKEVSAQRLEIKRTSSQLERLLSENDYEKIFDMIDLSVREWIEEAVEYELYETAANINKIINEK